MSKGIHRFPKTSLEPLNETEVIVVGGDSWNNCGVNADSVIIETVSSVFVQLLCVKINNLFVRRLTLLKF